MQRLEPARTIIERLGGPEVVASVTGTAYTAPYRWQHPRSKGGSGGIIPQKHIPALLAYAREHGKPLSADDFLPAHPAPNRPAPREGAAA